MYDQLQCPADSNNQTPGAGYKFIEDRINDYEKHKFKSPFGKSHFDDGSGVFIILQTNQPNTTRHVETEQERN